jgi:hypothetical protein
VPSLADVRHLRFGVRAVPEADIWRSADYDLNPVPPHRWHFIFLSPCLTRPLPSQFLHFTFGLPAFFCIFSPDCMLLLIRVCVVLKRNPILLDYKKIPA